MRGEGKTQAQMKDVSLQDLVEEIKNKGERNEQVGKEKGPWSVRCLCVWW